MGGKRFLSAEISADKSVASALALGLVALATAVFAALLIGPAQIDRSSVVVELFDRLPLLSFESGLSSIHENIVWEVRTPRVLLGALVGSTLAISGASYQAVFRNPLADPYLLGAAAGAGLGATVAIVTGSGDGMGTFDMVPLLAFVGAIGAVALTYFLGFSSGVQRAIGPSACGRSYR